MGVKSSARKGDRSEKEVEKCCDGVEEDVSLRESGSKESVDCSDERKETMKLKEGEKKKKKKHTEDEKMSFDSLDESRSGGVEQPKKRKREKRGGDVVAENVETGSDKGYESAKKKEKKSEKRKGTESEDVCSGDDEEGRKGKKIKKTRSADVSDVVGSDAKSDEEGSEKNKKKKKLASEDVSDGVESETKSGEEEGSDKNNQKQKKKKKLASEDVSEGVGSETKSDEEGSDKKKKQKKKKNLTSEDVSDGVGIEVKSVDEGSKNKKKKKMNLTSEDVSDGVGIEAKSDDEGSKKKKKKNLTSEDVFDGVGIEAKNDDDGSKKKKKKRMESENVSEGMKDGVEVDEESDKSTSVKKKRKNEDISGEEDTEMEKNRKKKAKVGKGEKGKAVAENDPKPKKKSKKSVRFSDDVEVFEDNPSKKKSWNKSSNKGLVQGKRFTPEEDEIVKNAVLNYIEGRALGDDGLEMVLNCRKHPEIRNCWRDIASAIPHRPLGSFYCRAHILFERSKSNKWTEEEMEYVREHYAKHGADWKGMGIELKKHRLQCKEAWRRIRLKDRNKGRWKQQEYQHLFDLVNMDLRMRAREERKSKHGMLRDNICWDAISDKLGTRMFSHCCTKWYGQLTSPMVHQGVWTDTDDYRLIDALVDLDSPSLEDVDWENLLEHREGQLSRRRWNQMVKHIGDYSKLSFSEQVEVLEKRYNPDCIEAREEFDSKPFSDVDVGDGIDDTSAD